MKKVICFTCIFHLLCFVSMIFGQVARNEQMVRLSWMADIGGTFVLPLAIAVAAMVTALGGGLRVIRLFPNAAATVGAIGLARAVLFLTIDGATGFRAAMMYLLISFLMLTLWFLIFEISSNLMNKNTKINSKFGGKRK